MPDPATHEPTIRGMARLSLIAAVCLSTASAYVLPLTFSARPALAQNDSQDEGSEPEEPLPAPDGRPPVVQAKSAILVDAATGTVLFEKDAHTRRPPASTTKIMTATLVIEHAGLDRPVVASLRAARTPYGLHLKPGEVLTMRDNLYAILLRSANDGCVAAAESIAGSVPGFIEMMNYKAQEIGCTDTHFVTPNGLYDPNHYTTAADLARMAIYATQNPIFNEVVATREKVISRSIDRADCVLRNHNKLLARYPGCDGIKTGYVHQSGRCLVASATRQENGHPWRLISVVLNSPVTYRDSAILLNYGFSHFRQIFVASKGEQIGSTNVKWGIPGKVPVMAGAAMTVVVPRNGRHSVERRFALLPQKAPLPRGGALGQVSLLVDGRPVPNIGLLQGKSTAAIPVLAAQRVKRDWLALAAHFAGGPFAVLMFMGLAPRYARTLTKGPRRRRRRVPARRRSADLVGPRPGRRPSGYHAWDES
jgi:serine-type D-Ala-D-Ala carboxypeptidase (penicillin-binding protein 5/6)